MKRTNGENVYGIALKGLESRLDEKKSKSMQGLQGKKKGSLDSAEWASWKEGPGPGEGAEIEA